jgi:hypothetical protein
MSDGCVKFVWRKGTERPLASSHCSACFSVIRTECRLCEGSNKTGVEGAVGITFLRNKGCADEPVVINNLTVQFCCSLHEPKK